MSGELLPRLLIEKSAGVAFFLGVDLFRLAPPIFSLKEHTPQACPANPRLLLLLTLKLALLVTFQLKHTYCSGTDITRRRFLALISLHYRQSPWPRKQSIQNPRPRRSTLLISSALAIRYVSSFVLPHRSSQPHLNLNSATPTTTRTPRRGLLYQHLTSTS
jgi:hypothetical protein